MSELKPCPFCGGDPFISSRNNFATCSNDLCDMSKKWISIKQWNTRTEAEHTAEMQEALRLQREALLKSFITETLCNAGLTDDEICHVTLINKIMDSGKAILSASIEDKDKDKDDIHQMLLEDENG